MLLGYPDNCRKNRQVQVKSKILENAKNSAVMGKTALYDLLACLLI